MCLMMSHAVITMGCFVSKLLADMGPITEKCLTVKGSDFRMVTHTAQTMHISCHISSKGQALQEMCA
jgi:hypothetical protein